MKKIGFILIALIIASCGGSKEVKPNLNGDYKLMALSGVDVSAQDLTFNFNSTENRVSGETGCNNFSAQYTEGNNVISIGRAMSTRMFCEGKMDTEQKIVNNLQDVAKFQRNGNEVVFYSTDNKELFTITKR